MQIQSKVVYMIQWKSQDPKDNNIHAALEHPQKLGSAITMIPMRDAPCVECTTPKDFARAFRSRSFGHLWWCIKWAWDTGAWAQPVNGGLGPKMEYYLGLRIWR